MTKIIRDIICMYVYIVRVLFYIKIFLLDRSYSTHTDQRQFYKRNFKP